MHRLLSMSRNFVHAILIVYLNMKMKNCPIVYPDFLPYVRTSSELLSYILRQSIVWASLFDADTKVSVKCSFACCRKVFFSRRRTLPGNSGNNARSRETGGCRQEESRFSRSMYRDRINCPRKAKDVFVFLFKSKGRQWNFHGSGCKAFTKEAN